MEGVIGQVGGITQVFVQDLVLDTAIYATGDTLADKLQVLGAVRIGGGTSVLMDILVIDKDDQGQPFDIVIFDRDFTLTGAKNAAWNVSDADMNNCLGVVSVATGDYIDTGGNRVAHKINLNIGIKPLDASKDIYIGTISRGTGTYTANGLRLKLTFTQD